MDYLAKFYKNQSEVLSEQIRILEAQLAQLMESEAPASTFSGTGAGQQRFSDLDLETQMRRHKRSGFFGAEVPDEKQSREYLDAKAELERRRGAKAPAREPVEQMGPVGSPSGVPTRTEVQKAQAVADQTGLPTALPTNVQPGTMSMTDMDGNPIAVQPRVKKPMAPKDFNQRASINQQAMEVEYDDGGDYNYSSGGYAQSPTSWRERYPSQYPTPPRQLGRVQGGETPAERKDLEDSAMGRGQYSSEQQKAEYMARLNRFMPKRGTSMTDTGTKSVYGTPPSPSLAPQTSGTSYINEPEDNISPTQPRINPRSAPVEPSDIDVTPRAIPRSVVKQIAKPPVTAGEDFSDFWKKRLSGGDVKSYMRDTDLEDMMKQNKRSNLFGPAISDDKQTIEYRAAQAELRRRGKIK